MPDAMNGYFVVWTGGSSTSHGHTDIVFTLLSLFFTMVIFMRVS
jgi:hypothetical protein